MLSGIINYLHHTISPTATLILLFWISGVAIAPYLIYKLASDASAGNKKWNGFHFGILGLVLSWLAFPVFHFFSEVIQKKEGVRFSHENTSRHKKAFLVASALPAIASLVLLVSLLAYIPKSGPALVSAPRSYHPNEIPTTKAIIKSFKGERCESDIKDWLRSRDGLVNTQDMHRGIVRGIYEQAAMANVPTSKTSARPDVKRNITKIKEIAVRIEKLDNDIYACQSIIAESATSILAR